MNKTKIIIGLNLHFVISGLKGRDYIEKQIINKKQLLFKSIGNPIKKPIFSGFFKELESLRSEKYLNEEPTFNNFGEFYALEYEKKSKEETVELLNKLNNKTIISFAEEDQEVIFLNNIKNLNEVKTKEYPYNIINYSPIKSSLSSKKLRVAILDTGVDYNHKYLKDCLWENPNKKGSYGFNYTIFNNEDWFDVKDESGHGTRVAGIIAANSQNEKLKGITNSVEILSFKIAPASDFKTYISDIILAFYIAQANNVKVFNNSWEIPQKSKALKLVLKFLENNNCIVIFGAGNDGCNVINKFPQNQPNVITVGSVGFNKKQSKFSNWGNQVDIWAPGENIYSTGKTNKYDYENVNKDTGTSFSAPFVTATAALLKIKNPRLNVHQVKELLTTNGTEFKLLKSPRPGKILNINKTISTNLFKTTKMNTQCTNLIPETHEDVNNCIFTFLHLQESEIFQLLHNETDSDGLNPFQIYGRFRNVENKSENVYSLISVDFKLVNFVKNMNFKIIAAEFRVSDDFDKPIDLDIYIGTVESQNTGIDITIEPKTTEPYREVLIEKGRIIDIHIKTIPNIIRKNGKPCNVKAH